MSSTSFFASLKKRENLMALDMGFHDGIPISMGYFAVAISLGIAARSAHITALQGFLASWFTMASAGEFVVFQLISENALYWEIAISTFVTNLRYILMSSALSQRLDENTSLTERLLLGTTVTDEIFGISIANPGKINPYYSIGAFLCAAPGWSIGTALGITLGNLLPESIVCALGVSLYGMFLAVIIPPAKNSPVLASVVAVSFGASYVANAIDWGVKISGGNMIIILTVIIASLAALLFPVKEDEP